MQKDETTRAEVPVDTPTPHPPSYPPEMRSYHPLADAIAFHAAELDRHLRMYYEKRGLDFGSVRSAKQLGLVSKAEMAAKLGIKRSTFYKMVDDSEVRPPTVPPPGNTSRYYLPEQRFDLRSQLGLPLEDLGGDGT